MKLNHLILATTTALLLATGTASADADGAFHSDVHPGIDMTSNSSGYTYDPVAAAFPDNPELFAGHEADVREIIVNTNQTSLDFVNSGSPESEICGCS